jgi:hypothetical protein
MRQQVSFGEHSKRSNAVDQCRPSGSERCRAMTPTCRKNRREAREIMQRLGYGPDNPVAVKVAARNLFAVARARSKRSTS